MAVGTGDMFRRQIRPLIEEKSKVPMRYENLTDAGFWPLPQDWDSGLWLSDLDGGLK